MRQEPRLSVAHRVAVCVLTAVVFALVALLAVVGSGRGTPRPGFVVRAAPVADPVFQPAAEEDDDWDCGPPPPPLVLFCGSLPPWPALPEAEAVFPELTLACVTSPADGLAFVDALHEADEIAKSLCSVRARTLGVD